MRKVLLTLLILAVVSVCLACPSVVGAKYSGGTGEPNTPYQIANVADLMTLANDTNDYNKCFIMIADIDLDPNLPGNQVFSTAIIARDINNKNTFFDGNAFTGVFDGNGHIISNAVINQPDSNYIGLFGYVGSGGQISNLGVEDVNITGRYYVGGLVGYNVSGTITSCYATGSVSGGSVGGLVGVNYGSIGNCYSTGTVSGTGGVGGLVGYNNGGSLTSCYSTGSVSGTNYVGGLVGLNQYGSLTSCYSTGSVSGTNYVGGLVGQNFSGTLTGCYATGLVTGNSYVGGLVGSNTDGGIINASFWDVNTSGQTTSAGGIGLTTSQLKSVTTYQNAGWANNGWVINDGADYPHLAWENTGGVPIPQPPPIPLSGSGTEQYPYQISTVDDFALLNQYIYVLDKHIALMADLDLSGITFYPIGYNMRAFTGVFEGNGHVIRNMNTNMPDSDYIGLFGGLGKGGQILNLGVEDVNIRGHYGVGGLVGYNAGSISNCYSMGAVSGYQDVGGLVGHNGKGNGDGGSISNCYSTGTVSGSYYGVGGLVGAKWYGSITNCYSTAVIRGGIPWVGGLVGFNVGGSISNCYFLVGSGPNNGLGTRLTDTQMKQQSSFIGWDFVGEIANGYDDIWRLCNEGLEYPKLAWQYLPGDITCPDGVDFYDLIELCYQWLFEEIPADLAPPGGDGIVDFADFAVFADQWNITADTNDLFVFAEQWLKTGLPVCSADISPLPDGDGRVNFADFAVMGNNWLQGF